MTERLGFTSWATGALVLVAVVGCGHSGTDPIASPTTPTVAASPSTTSSASPPSSPSEVASAQATQKLKDYYAVLDQIGQNPKSGLRPLTKVAISTELASERHFLQAQHQRGDRQVGSVKLVVVTVQSVNLDNSDPQAGKVPSVTIDVCHDVTNVDVLDSTGESTVLPERPEQGWTRFIVANYRWDQDPAGGWRVASSQDLKKPSCDAA